MPKLSDDLVGRQAWRWNNVVMDISIANVPVRNWCHRWCNLRNCRVRILQESDQVGNRHGDVGSKMSASPVLCLNQILAKTPEVFYLSLILRNIPV